MHTSAQMLRRYILASLVVFAVAFVVAIGLYAHDSVTYVASCRFRIQPAPTATQSTSDYFNFAGLVAQREVALAQSTPLYAQAADQSGVPAGTLVSETVVAPGPSNAYFSVAVTDGDAFRAARAANALCDAITAQVRQQRGSEQKGETDALTTKLVDLFQLRQTLTSQPPSQAGQAQITSVDKAITGVETQLAALVQRSQSVAMHQEAELDRLERELGSSMSLRPTPAPRSEAGGSEQPRPVHGE